MQRKERKKKKTKQLVEGGGEVFLSINVITYTNIAVAKSAYEKDVKRKKVISAEKRKDWVTGQSGGFCLFLVASLPYTSHS